MRRAGVLVASCIGCVWQAVCTCLTDLPPGRTRPAHLPRLPCCSDRSSGPSLVLLGAPDVGELRHAIPALADYPSAAVPLDPHASGAFPALGWQLPATKAALAQLVQMPQWLQVGGDAGWCCCCRAAPAIPAMPASLSKHSMRLPWQHPCSQHAQPARLRAGSPAHLPASLPHPPLQARIQAAQYAHLPLCSFGPDWVVDTCDALYARLLREAGHVLWAADPAQPDLASRPPDQAEAATLMEQQRETQVWGQGGQVGGTVVVVGLGG